MLLENIVNVVFVDAEGEVLSVCSFDNTKEAEELFEGMIEKSNAFQPKDAKEFMRPIEDICNDGVFEMIDGRSMHLISSCTEQMMNAIRVIPPEYDYSEEGEEPEEDEEDENVCEMCGKPCEYDPDLNLCDECGYEDEDDYYDDDDDDDDIWNDESDDEDNDD